jgi:hypothetical protein
MLFIFNKAVKEHAETHAIPYSTHSGEGISWSLHTNNTVIMFIIVLKYHIFIEPYWSCCSLSIRTCESGEGISWSLHTKNTVIMLL